MGVEPQPRRREVDPVRAAGIPTPVHRVDDRRSDAGPQHPDAAYIRFPQYEEPLRIGYVAAFHRYGGTALEEHERRRYGRSDHTTRPVCLYRSPHERRKKTTHLGAGYVEDGGRFRSGLCHGNLRRYRHRDLSACTVRLRNE